MQDVRTPWNIEVADDTPELVTSQTLAAYLSRLPIDSPDRLT